jgi:tetratricopeptide (TPR) repeat protein
MDAPMFLRLCLVLALVLPPAALAADAPVSPEAKRHVELGVDHYNAGRYAEAVKEFELAYRLSNRPALLFNIARAESKLGHEEAAIAFLHRYLEERPNAPDAPAVLAEIEAHEKALAEGSAKSKAESEAKEAELQAARAQIAAAEAQRKAAEASEEAARVERQRQAEREQREREERDSHWSTLRKGGLALAVMGPAFLIVGIGLGAHAAALGNDVSKKSGEFADCCVDIQRQGNIQTSAGIAFDVIGGAFAATGVILLIAARGPTSGGRVWLAPKPGGITVGGGW